MNIFGAWMTLGDFSPAGSNSMEPITKPPKAHKMDAEERDEPHSKSAQRPAPIANNEPHSKTKHSCIIPYTAIARRHGIS
jgi:hypothetical protein